MTNFVSVSTNAARIQDISLNPQKLAGQCAKLKCCLNYEVDAYVEGSKRMPSREITLETKDATYYYFKADILKGIISYSTDKNFAANLVNITGKRAFEVINMNRNGIKPDSLSEDEHQGEPKRPIDLLEQESLTRFDKAKKNKKKKKSNPAQAEGKKNEPKKPQTEGKKQSNKNPQQTSGNPQPERKPGGGNSKRRHKEGNRQPQDTVKKQQAPNADNTPQ